jgi:2-dehydropantoate 2-reductase
MHNKGIRMRVVIMGSGGVGGYVGARLQAAGAELAFVARGAHLAALQRDGLHLESPSGPLHLPQVQASDDPASLGTADLVLFCVKLWDTKAAAQQIAPLLGPHSRVVTLQNGIDSVALISRHLPPAQVLGGAIYLSAYIRAAGVIATPGGLHRLVVDADAGNPLLVELAQACSRATALDITLTPSVQTTLWEKFVVLTAISGSTALLRSTMGPILGNEQTHVFLRQLIDETLTVAAAAGHALPPGFAEAAMGRIAAMPHNFRASMAEDLDNGRRLELPWLSGRVHGLGLELGVPTPSHSAVYRALLLHAQGRTA